MQDFVSWPEEPMQLTAAWILENARSSSLTHWIPNNGQKRNMITLDPFNWGFHHLLYKKEKKSKNGLNLAQAERVRIGWSLTCERKPIDAWIDRFNCSLAYNSTNYQSSRYTFGRRPFSTADLLSNLRTILDEFSYRYLWRCM